MFQHVGDQRGIVLAGERTADIGDEAPVGFETLSVSGGVVNAAEALRLAGERAGS